MSVFFDRSQFSDTFLMAYTNIVYWLSNITLFCQWLKYETVSKRQRHFMQASAFKLSKIIYDKEPSQYQCLF